MKVGEYFCNSLNVSLSQSVKIRVCDLVEVKSGFYSDIFSVLCLNYTFAHCSLIAFSFHKCNLL